MFRVASSCAVFMLVVAPFGVFASWWGALLAFGVQVLVGTAFGSLVYALTARLSTPDGFALLFRLGRLPDVPVLRGLLPDRQPGPLGEWVARLTPLWHGVHLSRMFSSTRSTGGGPP